MKIVKGIIYGIVILLTVIIGAFFTLNIFSESHKLMVVMSGSMEPELKVNDVILVERQDDYEKDDIITFYTSNTKTVTHRIIDTVNGEYITKGDSNNDVDTNPVMQANVIGKVIFKIPCMGAAVLAIKQIPSGYILVAGTVLAAIFVFMVVYDWISKSDKDEEKNS